MCENYGKNVITSVGYKLQRCCSFSCEQGNRWMANFGLTCEPFSFLPGTGLFFNNIEDKVILNCAQF